MNPILPSNLQLRKVVPQKLRSLGLNETWLQKQLMDDPALLGLGDLQVIQREKIQASGGRLDFLMADFENDARYEVEVMLGAVDASHIIRTIEYWDIERQRYPTYQHFAVIVAEEITSRFFNVIRLLNRAVPIIAIQLSAFCLGNDVVLQFVRVLDTSDFGEETEGGPQELVNRAYWESKSQPLLSIADALLPLIPIIDGEPKIAYNKSHIAIGTSGYNFCWFYPLKVAWNCALVARVGTEQRITLVEELTGAGLDAKLHGKASIKLKLKVEDCESYKPTLANLLVKAEEWSRS